MVIRFAFHLRLTKDQCAIPDDPALWVTIHDDSRIAFSTKPSATAPYLSDLPTLFTSGPIADEGYPVIVMPERPDGEEFNAAGIVAHQLGNWSGRVLEVPMLGGVSSAEPAGDTPAILIGQGASLPVGGRWGALEWDGEQFLLNGVAVPADAGVLAMRQQPVPQLLVSGGSPDAVLQAAAAIAHVQDGSGYETSAIVVSGKLPETTEPREAWEEGAASFAQLGTGPLDVVGPGEHLIEMPFERPASWVLRDGGIARAHALRRARCPVLREIPCWR